MDSTDYTTNVLLPLNTHFLLLGEDSNQDTDGSCFYSIYLYVIDLFSAINICDRRKTDTEEREAIILPEILGKWYQLPYNCPALLYVSCSLLENIGGCFKWRKNGFVALVGLI